MKFLVLGCSGMAGHTISLYLAEKGHEVVGISRRRVSFLDNHISCDLSNIKFIEDHLSKNNYNIIVNAVGILNSSAELHKRDAILLNSYLPQLLVECVKDSNTRIFHLSTDCVFKGNTGPYYENSIPDGQTFYDRSKALGEIIDNKNLTFRNSIIGPDLDPNGIGLFNWFMSQNHDVQGYTNVIWNGITTVELAKLILLCAQSEISGLYHFVPQEPIRKFDLLKLFNSLFRDNHIKIHPNSDIKLNKTLYPSKLPLSYKIQGYESQIIEMRDWIYNHSNLYKHYF